MNTAVSVASLVSAFAIASPAGASQSLSECSFPELADRLASVRRRWFERLRREREDNARLNALATAETGITAKQAHAENLDGPKFFAAYFEHAKATRHEDPLNNDGQSIALNELSTEMEDVCWKVLRRKANTLADVIVQVQAAAFYCWDQWTGPDDGNDEANVLRTLVDSICAAAGVDPLPGASDLIVAACADTDGNSSDLKAQVVDHEAPVRDAIDEHLKAEAHLGAALDDLERIEFAARIEKSPTADTRRCRRNAKRRQDRAFDREADAWQSLLAMRPDSDLGKSLLIAYLRTELTEARGNLDGEELRTFLDSVHHMVTPAWAQSAAFQG